MSHTSKVWDIYFIMDSLTHIVLGACIGEVVAGKKLGKKAMLIGAIANSLPDIDILASPFLDHATDLLFHRGITHSFLFLVLVSPLLAWGSGKVFKKAEITFRNWWFFWALEMFVHLLIDSFTAYGTGWLEPFSQARVSFNAVFVLDPLYTICTLVAFVVLLFLKKENARRIKWAWFGIIPCAVYIVCCFVNKELIESKVQAAFASNHITPKKYFTTPTPINNLLWYVVAATDSGFYVGYRSVLDKTDNIAFRRVNQNDTLLAQATDKESLQKLVRFSKGYYCADLQGDSLYFSDMRFGEIGAWGGGTPHFVFSYCLQHPGANDNVLQRRRMAMMDKKALTAFWHRIMGEQ